MPMASLESATTLILVAFIRFAAITSYPQGHEKARSRHTPVWASEIVFWELSAQPRGKMILFFLTDIDAAAAMIILSEKGACYRGCVEQ